MKKESPLIIYLSFKKTEEDLKLYNWIIENNYKSAFIKSVLRKIMNEELMKNT